MNRFPGYPLTETWFPQGDFADLTMYHFGRHHCNPNYSVGPLMTWNHYLFHYVVSGKGVFYVADDSGQLKKYFLQSGQGFMIWPGQLCSYKSDELDPWEYAWVEFNGTKAKELVRRSGLAYNHPIYLSEDSERQELMESSLFKIIHNAHLPSMELLGYFYIFLSNLISSSSQHKLIIEGSGRETHLKKASEYIRQNYQRSLTVQDIADHCEIHRSYLFQLFMESLGISPTQFLIRHRMRKAGELMRTTGYSIGEISSRVGYSNQMNFSRAFKRSTGFTPREWKKSNVK
ncbi:MAG: AraC family transcriptional regulator [Oscillospiraceae bacterium]|nr:AraC family transcriptional regulator [Oscillospiraceae bacterium]MCL2278405.1 AraC family transcriptional regulator [Oscillospiraceae bacterium]